LFDMMRFIDYYAWIIKNYQIFKFAYRVNSFSKSSRIFHIYNYIREINQEKSLFNYLDSQIEQYRRKPYNSGAIDNLSGRVLYIITRMLKPEVILETGCGWGVSSTYFLLALYKNDKGRLFSLDLPRFEEEVNYLDYSLSERGGIIPEGKKPGWIIPDYLRLRWELIIGKSTEKLESYLNQLNQINIFFHDSLHSYENMLFEYQTSWPFIRKDLL